MCDENLLISCEQLLASNELSNIEELVLSPHAATAAQRNRLPSISNIMVLIKQVFTSAALAGTFNLLIVSKHTGAGYPFAAIFVLKAFSKSTLTLAYNFKYVTTNIDPRNITSITNLIGYNRIQIYL